MSHDLEDLLNLIEMLEERVMQLEKKQGMLLTQLATRMANDEDSWYWEHG